MNDAQILAMLNWMDTVTTTIGHSITVPQTLKEDVFAKQVAFAKASGFARQAGVYARVPEPKKKGGRR